MNAPRNPEATFPSNVPIFVCNFLVALNFIALPGAAAPRDDAGAPAGRLLVKTLATS